MLKSMTVPTVGPCPSQAPDLPRQILRNLACPPGNSNLTPKERVEAGMQSHSIHHSPVEVHEALLDSMTGLTNPDFSVTEHSEHSTHAEPTRFQNHFVGCMEMQADARTVGDYLDAHPGWFRRCAHPMKAEPISENGYALVIGRFGSFGYEIEPKIGLDLLPQEEGVYRIRTIAVPDYTPIGYDVDFQASLSLLEHPGEVDATMTHVEWTLDLEVTIHFPKFIHALPQGLIQTTGDRLLRQIVRQVSRRLTHKVQEDFHSNLGLALPKPTKKKALWARGHHDAL
jgi:hypothetical protein